MITIVVGSEGLIGRPLSKAALEISERVFTFDVVDKSDIPDSFRTRYYRMSVTESQFVTTIENIFTEFSEEKIIIIYTPALDFPVKDGSVMSSSRFSTSVSEMHRGLSIGFYPIYEIIRLLEGMNSVHRATFICFDSIYSMSLPKRNFYQTGIKPISYSISKAPLRILAKAFASEFSRPNNSARFYIVRLSCVQSKTLPKRFVEDFMEYSGAFSLVDTSEIIELISWLSKFNPLSMSGTVIECVGGYSY